MPRARSKKSKNSLRDASTKIEAARRTPSETPIRLGIEKSFECYPKVFTTGAGWLSFGNDGYRGTQAFLPVRRARLLAPCDGLVKQAGTPVWHTG
jgi:hypothetical protein